MSRKFGSRISEEDEAISELQEYLMTRFELRERMTKDRQISWLVFEHRTVPEVRLLWNQQAGTMRLQDIRKDIYEFEFAEAKIAMLMISIEVAKAANARRYVNNNDDEGNSASGNRREGIVKAGRIITNRCYLRVWEWIQHGVSSLARSYWPQRPCRAYAQNALR